MEDIRRQEEQLTKEKTQLEKQLADLTKLKEQRLAELKAKRDPLKK